MQSISGLLVSLLRSGFPSACWMSFLQTALVPEISCKGRFLTKNVCTSFSYLLCGELLCLKKANRKEERLAGTWGGKRARGERERAEMPKVRKERTDNTVRIAAAYVTRSRALRKLQISLVCILFIVYETINFQSFLS